MKGRKTIERLTFNAQGRAPFLGCWALNVRMLNVFGLSAYPDVKHPSHHSPTGKSVTYCLEPRVLLVS